MPKVVIYGSCVTRDAFEIAPPELELLDFSARSSLGSAFASSPFALSLDDIDPDASRLPSPWQRRMVDRDLAKSLPATFRPEADILAIDFVDERFPLLELDGTLATHSTHMVQMQATERFPGIRTIPWASADYMRFWREGLVRFAQVVEGLGLRVVLNKVYWAAIDDQGQPFDASARVEHRNRTLAAMYRAAESALGCDTIEYDGEFVAAAGHKWGRYPVHYVPAVYRNFIRQLAALQ